MMKLSLFLVMLVFSSCLHNNRIISSYSILENNKAKLSKKYAKQTMDIKKLLLPKYDEYNIDTLYLIERIDEVSMKSEIAMWNSKKNTVFILGESEIIHLSDSSKFKYKIDTFTLNYKEWVDPLLHNTEDFDTVELSKQRILGGSRTFLSRVIYNVPETFLFDDFTSGYSKP